MSTPETTIDTLTNLLRDNRAYDIPIEFIDDKYGLDMRGVHRDDPVNIIQTTLYTYLRDTFRKLVRCGKSNIQPSKIPKYPIHSINNKKYLSNPVYGQQILLKNPVPLIHAETNESFQLILTILNDQNQRIRELEEVLSSQPSNYSSLHKNTSISPTNIYNVANGDAL